MWLLFALLFPFCFAVVSVLDSYCVEKIFDRPWMGVITGSLASSVAFLLIPACTISASWTAPDWHIVLLALLAGALIQMMQGFYFQALAYSEAGIVTTYLNLIPVILPVTSWLLFRTSFGLWTYIGITVSIAASVAMCLVDSNFEARWKSFFMMLAGCLSYSVGILFEKYIFDRIPVLQGFLLVTTGIVISGTLPLLLPKVRQAFRENWLALRPAGTMIVLIEVINLLAIYFRHRALSLGDPSLTEAVAASQPAHTFMLSYILCFVAPRFSNPQVRNNLPLKLTLITIMGLGVYLIEGQAGTCK